MQNQLYMLQLGTKLNIQSLRQPIDRTTWQFPPVIVNAFYNPSLNDICKLDFLIIYDHIYVSL